MENKLNKCTHCEKGTIKSHKSAITPLFDYDICDKCYMTRDSNGKWLKSEREIIDLLPDNSPMFKN